MKHALVIFAVTVTIIVGSLALTAPLVLGFMWLTDNDDFALGVGFLLLGLCVESTVLILAGEKILLRKTP